MLTMIPIATGINVNCESLDKTINNPPNLKGFLIGTITGSERCNPSFIHIKPLRVHYIANNLQDREWEIGVFHDGEEFSLFVPLSGRNRPRIIAESFICGWFEIYLD